MLSLGQVKLTAPCQLVTARQVVPGQLRVTTLQLRFLGDHPADDGPAKVCPQQSLVNCTSCKHGHLRCWAVTL